MAPQVGDTILLTNGYGPKARYNWQEAIVTKLVPKSSWMYVSLTSSQTALCWRKGSYKMPSLASLEFADEVMEHILGYLSKSDNNNSNQSEGWSLYDLSKIHPLSTLDKGWRSFFTRFPRSIHADLSQLAPFCRMDCIMWMIRRRVKILSLKLYELYWKDGARLCEMLSHVDTDHLTHVDLSSYAGDPIPGNLSWNRQGLEDWTPQSTIALFDCIGSNCPNLQTLVLSVYELSTLPKLLASTLFAMPSVRHLELVIKHASEDVSPFVFSKAIRNFANLETLLIDMGGQGLPYRRRDPFREDRSQPFVREDPIALSRYRRNGVSIEEAEEWFGGQPRRYWRFERLHRQQEPTHRRFHIQSPTLQKLNVALLPVYTWVTCDCPKLEELICGGSNGTRPYLENYDLLEKYKLLYYTRWLDEFQPFPFALERVIDCDFNDFSRALRVPIGTFPSAFLGLNVHESCSVVLLNYTAYRLENDEVDTARAIVSAPLEQEAAH